MPRRLRRDAPGAIFHLVGRGLAKRSIADSRRERRFFLSLLARAVRRGDLEVLAFALLTNHYHLLVRSPRGRLCVAMQYVLSRHVRRFNRSRDRDGPLFRSRYWSRRVRGERDFRNVVRYVDYNAVEAGLAVAPEQYEFGSAARYRRASGPPWLARTTVEEFARGWAGSAVFRAGDYDDAFGQAPTESLSWVLAKRVEGGRDGPDELEGAGVGALDRWLSRSGTLADGTPSRHVFASPAALCRAVDDRQALDTSPWLVTKGQNPWSGWEVLRCCALRLGAGLAASEIAARLGASPSRVRRILRKHGEIVSASSRYRQNFAEVVADVLRGR